MRISDWSSDVCSSDLLGPEARSLPIDHVKTRLDPETITYLDEVVREDILGQLAPEEVAAAITELETDDPIDVFEDVSEEQQAQVLDTLSPSDQIGTASCGERVCQSV